MEELIKNAKKILIAIPIYADFDRYIAAISLAHILNIQGKQISLLLPDNQHVKRLMEIFPTQNLKIITKTDPESYIVSLDKDRAVIKDVKWKEEQGKINIFITTDKGVLNKNAVSIKPNYALFDTIVVIGVKGLKELGEFYDKNPRAFPKNRIIQIGNLSRKVGLYQFEEDGLIFSELVYKFAKFLGLETDGEISTNLLAGILWKTDGLNRVDDSQVLDTISELAKSGANLKTASNKAFQNISLRDTRLLAELMRNIEISEDGILFSFVKAANKKAINSQELINSSWAMLDRIEDVNISIVAIEEAHGNSIYVLTKIFDALKIAKAFAPVGDKFIAFFKTKEGIDSIRANLVVPSGMKKIQDSRKKENFENAVLENSNQGVGLNTNESTGQNISNNEQNQIAPLAKKGETPLVEDPLKPASQIPTPLRLDDVPIVPAPGQVQSAGGFAPPPPINPMNDAN